MSRSLVLDLVVGSTVIVAAVRGWSRGSIRETFSLLGLATGLLAAVLLTGPLESLLTAVSSLEIDPARLAAAGFFMTVCLAAGFVVGYRVAKGTTIPGPRHMDGLGGTMFAIVRSLLIVALVLYVLDAAWGPSSQGHRMIADSVSGVVLVSEDSPFSAFYSSLAKHSQSLRELEKWARASSAQGSVGYLQSELRATDARLTEEPGAERIMFRIINDARQERGLRPLEWCEPCADVARAHSKDMYRNGYFAHVSLDGIDPFERMQAARIPYDAAGENLALAPTVQEAHDGLMQSPDHRANILRVQFDEVGIGIYDGPYGLMCTQVFRTLP